MESKKEQAGNAGSLQQKTGGSGQKSSTPDVLEKKVNRVVKVSKVAEQPERSGEGNRNADGKKGGAFRNPKSGRKIAGAGAAAGMQFQVCRSGKTDVAQKRTKPSDSDEDGGGIEIVDFLRK